MAVYQGARLGTPVLQRRGPEGPARRVVRPVAAAVPRLRPTAMLMAAVVAATMVGFAYLTQTLASNATVAEIARLNARMDEIRQQRSVQALAVEQWSDETNLAGRARKLGLVDLGDATVLKAP
jgi:hypothetical protein